ncbi:MAG TPA: LysM peptidoglycan-binding domain-containing protein [Anaerolineaceae bacterium]
MQTGILFKGLSVLCAFAILCTPLARVSASSEFLDPQIEEPAGCLSLEKQAAMTVMRMLDYASSFIPTNSPLSNRSLPRGWNSLTSSYQEGGGVLFLSFNDLKQLYEINDYARALYVAGFLPWVRQDPLYGLHILAIPLIPGKTVPQTWEAYVQAYWSSDDSRPPDKTIITKLRLAPCRWMQQARFAPSLSASWMESSSWHYPDLDRGSRPFIAPTYASAIKVAVQINWVENGDVESPTNMCGPLTWAILQQSRAFPPMIGGWEKGPISFWLPSPKQTGRPWNLFPSGYYYKRSFSTPLSQFNFENFPLYPGDLIYAYSEADGFDHIFVITEIDRYGRRYAVSNVVIMKPQISVTIDRVLIYDPFKPDRGILKSTWNDIVNGRTGHNGFEVFRWSWLQKDVSGVAASHKIQAGDTLASIATLWHTDPTLIADRNQLDSSKQLQIGEVITIPAASLFPWKFYDPFPTAKDRWIFLHERRPE